MLAKQKYCGIVIRVVKITVEKQMSFKLKI
jgi:hypothetical protein